MGAFIAGLSAGVLSGLGVGGGTLLVIYLMNFTDVSQLSAQLLNLIYFLPTAGASLVSHIKNGLVDRKSFFCAAIPGTAAAALGALAASSLETGILRKLFGALLIAAGAAQIFKKRRRRLYK